MEELKLKISFEEFEVQIQSWVKELGNLCKVKAATEDDHLAVKKRYDLIDGNIEACFQEIFTNPKHQFFKNVYSLFFLRLPGYIPTLQTRIEDIEKLIGRRLNDLKILASLIKISDAIRTDISANLNDRSRYTIKKKQELLLEKLYELVDGKYYSIEAIYEGNGLIKKTEDEILAISEHLESQRLIEIEQHNLIGTNALLTLEGQSYVEEILQKRQVLHSSLNSVKIEFGGNSPEFTTLNKNLKNRVTQGIDDELFDKLDLLLADGEAKDVFYTIRGRFGSLLSSNMKGVIAHQDYVLETNRISDSLITLIDRLSNKNLKPQ